MLNIFSFSIILWIILNYITNHELVELYNWTSEKAEKPTKFRNAIKIQGV